MVSQSQGEGKESQASLFMDGMIALFALPTNSQQLTTKPKVSAAKQSRGKETKEDRMARHDEKTIKKKKSGGQSQRKIKTKVNNSTYFTQQKQKKAQPIGNESPRCL